MNVLQVAVTDLYKRGGTHFLYRLRIVPAGRPNFELAVSADRLHLAQDGSAAMQFDVVRSGYNGPIHLSVLGDPNFNVAPAEIPAGVTKGWITLFHKAANPANAAVAMEIRNLQIIGESVDVNPPLRRLGLTPVDGRLSLVHGHRGNVLAWMTPAGGISLELGALSPSLFRGVDAEVPLTVSTADATTPRALRFSLLSTEAPRLNVPNDASKGNKPKVDAPLNQALDGGEKLGVLRINVPTDVAEGSLDFVIKAEVVEHPYSPALLGTIYSRPFRLSVQNAVALQPAANNLNLVGGAQAKFPGTLKRTPGFAAPVEVLLMGFPQGYVAPKVTLAPDQETFELAVTPPAVTQAADVPNIVLRVTSLAGVPLLGDMPIATKVAPAAQ